MSYSLTSEVSIEMGWLLIQVDIGNITTSLFKSFPTRISVNTVCMSSWSDWRYSQYTKLFFYHVVVVFAAVRQIVVI